MAPSSNATECLIGGGLEATMIKNTYVEADLSALPFSGNNMSCFSLGGGFYVGSEKEKIKLSLGLNFFQLNRKAILGKIDNQGEDVFIAGKTFYNEYYKSRKKDSVTVYDLYEATSITVSHNESYMGVQPKFILGFEDEKSPAVVRIHLGWNIPLGHVKYINFDQSGYRVATVNQKPVNYPTRSEMSLSATSAYFDYQNSSKGPSYTSGFFMKLEVGIKIFTKSGN